MSIFLCKKIIAPFFLPLPLSLLIVLLGLFLLWFTGKQKSGKSLVSIGVLILLFCSYAPTSDFLMKPLENLYPPYAHEIPSPKSTERPRYVVVLGGGHTSDPSLPITSQINSPSLTRLIEGIRIHRRIPGSTLLLSGGGAFDPVSEAEIMARVAESIGVSRKSILYEGKSKDTKDQAEMIKAITGKNKFVLVTSASHMPRAMALFRKLGMNPIPAPTRHLVKAHTSLNPDIFFPSSVSLHKSERAFHEYFGLIWASLRGQTTLTDP